MNKQPLKQEKIFVKNISGKELISKVYGTHTTQQQKEQKQQQQKKTRKAQFKDGQRT